MNDTGPTISAPPTPVADQRAAQLAQARAQARAKARMAGKKPDIKPADVLAQLPLTQRPTVERRLADMPPKCRPAYLRAMGGKSRLAAIRAKCNECMGWEGLPYSVRDCTAPACPLYPYRPGAG